MMQKIYSHAYVLLMLITITASAQTQSQKLSVFIEINNFSDSTVTLAWENYNKSTTTLSRKKIEQINWTVLASNYSGSSYTDSTIEVNVEYEYKFQVANNYNTNNAYGYISFGVNLAAKTDRGNILLVVDDRFTTTLSASIYQLKRDLISDGWNPLDMYVSKNEAVTSVKTKIDSANASNNLNSIYLIGHVPVPYAGVIAPDGHGNHRGAWATDLFYVSDASKWTDSSINFVNSQNNSMSNVPGDGKFDNHRLEEQTNCPISRVDFYNLPSQTSSELNMLINYFSEASKYKNGKIEVKEAGLIDNQFINANEGFAANGYRNFKSLTGDSITEGAMLSNLEQETYKWTYAVSYGTDTSMYNVASVTDLNNSSYKGIFSMVLGSYFADWNTQDNFMRSLLADGKMLTTCWAGRPNWFYHHMGLNNPIGLSAKMTAENNAGWSSLSATKYDAAGGAQNQIHITLLGDPTLRLKHLPSIAGFNAIFKKSNSTTKLSWAIPTANSTSTVSIYKSTDSTSGYSLLATVAATDSTYVDSSISDIYFYYIKYTTLDTTLSGTYYNNSLGSFIRSDTTTPGFAVSTLPAELITFTATKSGNNGNLNWITATEKNVSQFEIQRSNDLATWKAIGTQKASGNSATKKYYNYVDYNLPKGFSYYRLVTTDFDGHTEISQTKVLENEEVAVTIFPNPSNNNKVQFMVGREITLSEYNTIEVTDMRGNSIPFQINQYTNELTIDARKGVYFIQILDKVQRVSLL
jgi:hypothetical protein